MTESILIQISEHVYWMPPSDPYYPSLCAVVGQQQTLMLDAGADAAHAHRFLDALAAEGLPSPAYIALTHWHFDHIMGASVLAVPVIAHQDTAAKIAALALYDPATHNIRSAKPPGITSLIPPSTFGINSAIH